jgi:hypothetical protein
MQDDSELRAPAAAPIRPFPLRAGLAQSELSLDEVWYRYVGMGGTLSRTDLEAVLSGEPVAAGQYDVIAQVLNEYFLERGGDHPVAYADEIDAPDPPSRS